MATVAEDPPLATTVAEDPPLATLAEDPPLATVAEDPPLATTVAEDPPLATLAEDPPLATVAEDPPPATLAEDPPPATTVAEDPPLATLAEDPPLATVAEDPPLATVADAPPLAPPKLGLVLIASAFFFFPFFYLVFIHYRIEEELRRSIAICVAMSFAGFVVCLRMIPVAARYVLKRNMFGYDINKKGTPQGNIKVPESLGIVIGIVYLVIAILFQHFNFTADSNWLVEYNAALACICFMTLLGFVDDVLDVPWRIKLVLPSFAALPLLMAYAGHTSIMIPKPLVPYVGVAFLDLGWIYKLYMGMLAVFCTNSINIHAGLNGLEAGQTVVIAAAILIHNVMQIGASSDVESNQAHAFSIYLMLPLLTTSLALLSYNWYPSSVFVGDTYTYFAGMAMAVVGILGHFSETLVGFFMPQVINFIISCPQLFKIFPCPRHRLPSFDPKTGLLTGTKNGTLVNLFLILFGECSEKSLCIRLLIFQIMQKDGKKLVQLLSKALSCLVCFWVRYIFADWY